MAAPTVRQISLVFFRIGNLTFGGGYPTIAALQREILERREWMGRDRFELVFSLARLTPGAILNAFCAGAGWQIRGTAGAIATVLAVTVPSSVLVLALTKLIDFSTSMPAALAAIGGIVAAAIGMMGSAAWQLVGPYLTRRDWLRTVLFVGGALVLPWKAGFSPVQVLLAALVIGVLWKEPEAQ